MNPETKQTSSAIENVLTTTKVLFNSVKNNYQSVWTISKNPLIYKLLFICVCVLFHPASFAF